MVRLLKLAADVDRPASATGPISAKTGQIWGINCKPFRKSVGVKLPAGTSLPALECIYQQYKGKHWRESFHIRESIISRSPRRGFGFVGEVIARVKVEAL